MSKPAAPKPRRSVLDMSVGGYVLSPEAKAAIKNLATRVARLDNRRRALIGQRGPSPLEQALGAAGLAPATGGLAAPPRPGPRPPSPLVAAARDYVDDKARTVADNLDYYGDRLGSGIEAGRGWVEQRPGVVRENLEPLRSAMRAYGDMISKVDMTDAGTLTPEQWRLREQARRDRPSPDYNLPYFQAIRRNREALNPIVRQVDAGGRTFADTVSWGGANYLAAVGDTLANDYSYAQNLEGERYIDLLDSQDARIGQVVGRAAGALVPIGNKYVAAGKTLPAVMGRAALVEGAKGFAHDAIATRGDLEERVGSGLQGGLADGMYAPLGPLAERGAAMIAPLAVREHPLLDDIVGYLAANAPQELAAAVAQAESRRRPAP